MRKEPVRVALVGCGRVAQHYKKILDSGVCSGWKVVAACAAHLERAQPFADHFGGKAYSDYRKMLAEQRPELVLVLTPSGHHYEHAKAALEAGCHVLVEKPIAMLVEHALELDALAKKKRLMCGVAFQNRLNPAIRALKKAVDGGRFGKIITAAVRLRWCRLQEYYEDGWHGTWAQDGGVVNQQAIHHVDAFNWLAGPVAAVSATITRRMNKLEAEDTLVAAARFASGALGTIEVTTAARPQDFEASLSILGEKGYAHVGGIALNKIEQWSFVDALPEDRTIPQEFSQDVPNGYGLSHGPLLQAVFDALRSGSIEPPVPAASGLETSKVIHALYASDEAKAWVELKDEPASARLGRQAGDKQARPVCHSEGSLR